MFRVIYYSLFKFLSKTRPKETPAFDAYLILSLFQCMNVLSIFGVINYFIRMDIAKNAAVIMGITLYLLTTIINFFALFRKRHFIFSQFDKFSLSKIKTGKYKLLTYLLVSTAIFLYVLFNLVSMKQV
jgi:hypothetical protein